MSEILEKTRERSARSMTTLAYSARIQVLDMLLLSINRFLTTFTLHIRQERGTQNRHKKAGFYLSTSFYQVKPT